MSPEGSAFEGVIGDLSSRFIGIEAARFDEEVAHALRTIGEWFGTDRASIMEFSSDLATLTTAHAWARQSDVEVRPPRVVQQSMPWYFEQLQRGRDVVFGSLPAELPAQAVAEREYAAHVGMRAIMTLPLAVGGRIQWVISTGDFTQLREWTPIDVNRLRIIGEILAGAAEVCAQAGCAVAGGHSVRDTEVKFGLSVTGIVHPARILRNSTARPGDRRDTTRVLASSGPTTSVRPAI